MNYDVISVIFINYTKINCILQEKVHFLYKITQFLQENDTIFVKNAIF